MFNAKAEGGNVIKGYNAEKTITFTIDDVSYTAYEGMTWLNWVNSDFNTNDKFSSSAGIYVYDIETGEYVRRTDGTGEELAETVIEDGVSYTIIPEGGIGLGDE